MPSDKKPCSKSSAHDPLKRPREDLLTVGEAAEELNITERTVWNLKKANRLNYEEFDKRVWISRTNIARYRLIHKDSRIRHAFSSFPSAAAASFQRYVAFGPWGEMGEYPQYELEVTVEDWLRLAAKSAGGRVEYGKIRGEVRDRIGPQAPESFAVQFKIDQASLAETLKRAIHHVKIPKQLLYLYDDDDIRSMAMEHLLDHTLLRLHKVKGDPSDYLIRAVSNFYIDLQRQVNSRTHPEIAYGGPDEVEVQLIAATHRLSGRRGEIVDKRVNEDQLFHDLRRGSPTRPNPKRKPRK